MNNFNLEPLYGGAGLRHAHFEEVINKRPPFRWFEIITDDFVDAAGYSRDCLLEIRKHYQIISHTVCFSIGSTDPLDMEYLKKMKAFLELIDTPWTSDHLCFTMVDHTNLLDLMPLPFTEEAVNNVAERVRIIQDVLEKPFLIENVTRYITVSDREMGEAEFISRILEKANCGLLLDVTNAYLNSKFHGQDAWEFISSLPLSRVGQIHVAGWEPDEKGEIIDSHDAPVPPEVWDLLRKTISTIGPTSVLVEWDNHLPGVDRLLEETQMADKLIAEATASTLKAA